MGTGIVNVAAVRHLSPFRYPGGKTWLVPYVRDWVLRLPMPVKRFVEPFAGGAIVGLTMADEGLVEKVVLAELDDGVAAVWKTILGRGGDWLVKEILNFEVSREAVVLRLGTRPTSQRELAFQTILRNRVQRGGILAPGASLMLNGEKGKGVASRWYPRTLAARIEHLRAISPRIEFHHADAFKVIRRHARDPQTAWFIDPPYTAGGKRAGSRLYAHNDVDHSSLFAAAASMAGPTMLTYDDAQEVRRLARLHGLACDSVPMKNTHHQILHELVITNHPARGDGRRAVGRGLADELNTRVSQLPLFVGTGP